jgi:hypothetical protein
VQPVAVKLYCSQFLDTEESTTRFTRQQTTLPRQAIHVAQLYVWLHLWLQVILTYGMSDTTLLFLREASRKREFQVGQECCTVIPARRIGHCGS